MREPFQTSAGRALSFPICLAQVRTGEYAMRLTTMAQFFGDKIAGWKPGLWNCNRSGFVEFLDTRLVLKVAQIVGAANVAVRR